jgi:uncharacterized oxidoreductase
MKLTNKVILITGGASGIGFALASVLSGQNKVIIAGRSREKLEQAQKQIPGLEFIQADITQPQQIDDLFGQLKERNIVPDVLFNNAGVIEVWDIQNEHLPSQLIFDKLNTNLAGPVALTSQFIRQANTQRPNLIVNITTEAAIMPVPILPLYSASKAGLSVFTLALRAQLKKSSFTVVEIIPPAVETKMTTEDLSNTTKLVQPIDFARNMIAQIEAGRLEYAPSKNAGILRLLRRFLPRTGLQLVDKMSRKQLLGPGRPTPSRQTASAANTRS